MGLSCGKVRRMTRARTNDPEQKRTASALIKSVAILQLKLLLDAARDLALAPLAIAVIPRLPLASRPSWTITSMTLAA